MSDSFKLLQGLLDDLQPSQEDVFRTMIDEMRAYLCTIPADQRTGMRRTLMYGLCAQALIDELAQDRGLTRGSIDEVTEESRKWCIGQYKGMTRLFAYLMTSSS